MVGTGQMSSLNARCLSIEMIQCFVNQNAHVYMKQYTFSWLIIMKIPTQKGEHSCKCTELSIKQQDGVH